MKNGVRVGGRLLVDALRANRVDAIFGVPGESYLEALDALYDHPDSVRYITCRQEGGAAFMADAYANATGKLGVCFVTRGPGATNASIGVHTAYQGSTPLLLLIGQVPRGQTEREAFQEIDYRRMLGPLTKWVAQVDEARRIPEFVNRAIRIATSGRLGPVALAFPEDVLLEETDAHDLPPAQSTPLHPALDDMACIRQAFARAEHPLVILGGTGWTMAGWSAIRRFVEANDLPVATGFRRQSLFDNAHDNYVGNIGYCGEPPLNDYVRKADVALAIGSRLGEVTTMRYSLIEAPMPTQTLIHVHPGVEELGRVFQAHLMIHAGVNEFAEAAATLEPINAPVWSNTRRQLRQAYVDGLVLPAQTSGIDMAEVMAHLRTRLPADAIVANGAGNFADWPNKFYQYRDRLSLLAPINGAMGYGVPAAIAAKLAHPQRVVVAFSGDGDFLMNGQELATAVQYGAAPVILIVNNNMYGTIRLQQELRHPGRVSGTDLMNPDFSAYARSFGAYAETIERTRDFAPALERALSTGRAAILELRVGPEHLGPNLSVSGLARARRSASEGTLVPAQD